MRKGSTGNQYIKLFYSAIIATWLNREEKGFRQKDVRFYLDLILDWMESAPFAKNVVIQNTQMMRFLEQLVEKQWLTKKNQNPPVYFFNNKHFMELIRETLSTSENDPYEVFFLQFHLASVYRESLSEMLFIRGVELSRGQKIDIEHLLNEKFLLRNQIERIELEIKKISLRQNEISKMINFSKEELSKNSDAIEVAKKLETKYPYQLQYQKSMSKAFLEIHPKLRSLELTLHSEKRMMTLWSPMENYLRAYLSTLESMQQQT
ncbi:hypothetical protein SHI21_06235 [Bacteriovorax sp. PP10]|uniref:Uncharacterized protein n=1 Tax=Bacteriovorax antarcticus TaxID=3088717 RepID=A0ABU5VRW6_9BACT|nr:hypothetical protein [Bacteriovorax sp. PP10]MEA9355788.1 hypothetical protein [Bacteriovorax sp. PP10]